MSYDHLYNPRITSESGAGVELTYAIRDALRMSEETKLPVDLVFNDTVVRVSWEEAVHHIAKAWHVNRERERKGATRP